MAVLFSLLVMSRLAQSSPLFDETEGARYLESQVTPTPISHHGLTEAVAGWKHRPHDWQEGIFSPVRGERAERGGVRLQVDLPPQIPEPRPQGSAASHARKEERQAGVEGGVPALVQTRPGPAG